MGKTKKLIELDDKAIAILEKQAKLQKRSLKNYIEYTLEDMALRYSEPSEEYKKMMDDMIDRMENGTLKTIPFSDVLKKYGREL
ncbi:hypothetical protein [Jejuia pallidilutea]|uniref:Uncharacterized protein n=1 Tax=Jejuia pallidilutea TaxID=504487 RepID=A0A090VS12_9FLAO|nr:hypothetical protein [Jejuia pallidilutea]GAL66813.1 hypothetical protein JCM19301_1357 [Jejuia pallidilutea]GAL70398.1 hypothetical protein JCM19302_3520 [Jejuia pallidilutea]GAL90473.1 hypothetical protein JCM19538_238 [Jejuia pallidilutea]